MKLNRESSLCLAIIGCLLAQVSSQTDSCNSATNCSGCYARSGCSWCSSPTFFNSRCFSSLTNQSSCGMIENSQNSITVDELGLNSDNQISLRRATLRLRTGTTQKVNVSIRPAENFPLDLYMLVDLSMSLDDDLATIKSIASDIADTIRNISTRFQVGFGTFVDKLTPPYVSGVQIRGFNVTLGGVNYPMNCRENVVCQLPFSYVHNVDLTNDSMSFSDGFQNLLISTNTDSPEGTFDAILQSSLCNEVVGWRGNSRKILLVITDDTTHTAGDGKLAGIATPVPSQCLTTLNPQTGQMTYINNTFYDYPSVEQLRQVFINNSIVPVFAVTDNVLDLYRIIANSLVGTGAVSDRISNDSSNIIDLIQTSYENIISNVRLSFQPVDGITINYRAICPEGANTSPDGLSCSNVTVNRTSIFNIEVTLDRCSERYRNGQSDIITVNVPAYGSFQIEVVGICTCDCEYNATDDITCSGNGILSCGVCECDSGYLGGNCDCFESNVTTLTCPEFGGLTCSGRGECQCGECQCNLVANEDIGNNRYRITDNEIPTVVILEGDQPTRFGDACECDNFRCPANDTTGLVCSGQSQGNCTCMNGNPECRCFNHTYGNLPYFGSNCQCSMAFCYDQAVPFNRNRPCGGNGTCSNPCDINAPCQCNASFTGRYCSLNLPQTELCSTDYHSCVQCIADNELYQEQCSSCLTAPNIQYMRLSGSQNSTYQIPETIVETTERCSFQTPDPLCTYVYFIGILMVNGNRIIHVQPIEGCFPLRWWHLALILLAVLIIVGIIILVIIRLIIMCLDYAELKKFQKEVAEADLSKNFNPLYQSPEVKYDNVAFGKE